jgi:hypothetical protein
MMTTTIMNKNTRPKGKEAFQNQIKEEKESERRAQTFSSSDRQRTSNRLPSRYGGEEEEEEDFLSLSLTAFLSFLSLDCRRRLFVIVPNGSNNNNNELVPFESIFVFVSLSRSVVDVVCF